MAFYVNFAILLDFFPKILYNNICSSKQTPLETTKGYKKGILPEEEYYV